MKKGDFYFLVSFVVTYNAGGVRREYTNHGGYHFHI